jgi:hypothetical protein
MKVSNADSVPPPSYKEQNSAPSTVSGKFDRVLEAKRKQRDEKQKDDAGKDKPHAQPPNGSQQEISTSANPPVEWKAEQTSAQVSETAAFIQNLSGEIVGELRSVGHEGGAHTIDIQFDSKTLDGLHVQLSAQADALSLRFDAASPQVGTLLSEKSQELTIALERKGFRVNGLLINTKGKNQHRSAQGSFRPPDQSVNG